MKVKLFPRNNRLANNGYSMKDEEDLYLRQLQEVLDKPRWYLDNLDNMREYRLSWVDYKSTKVSLPHEFCHKNNKNTEPL